jgi:hypothetical protein
MKYPRTNTRLAYFLQAPTVLNLFYRHPFLRNTVLEMDGVVLPAPGHNIKFWSEGVPTALLVTV